MHTLKAHIQKGSIMGLLILFPFALYAAPRNFAEVVSLFLWYIQLLIPLVFGLAFVVTIWGVVQAWVIHGDDTEKISEGRMIALYGVLGLAVMAGLWGLVALFRTSLFGNI